MDRLSVLIFSRDDASAVQGLIKSLDGLADEIVIVDSSAGAQRSRLERLCRGYGRKVMLHTAVALGYPDPLRMYGLHRCSNRWVLLIDTDERVSEALKRDMKEIISADSASAFAIRRSEPVRKGEIARLYTWQIRLFRKDRVEFTGLVHEQAMVRGTLAQLDSSLYTLQHARGIGGKAPAEYSKMAMFERLSYDGYNNKIMDYISKLVMGSNRTSGDGQGGIVAAIMVAYERLLSRNPNEEISDFDYFCYFWMRNISYSLIRGEYMGALLAVNNAYIELKAVRGFKEADRSGEAFEISKIINKIGIIKFLGLDKDATVEALNRKYGGSAHGQGVQLLQRLLLERYRKGKIESNK